MAQAVRAARHEGPPTVMSRQPGLSAAAGADVAWL